MSIVSWFWDWDPSLFPQTPAGTGGLREQWSLGVTGVIRSQQDFMGTSRSQIERSKPTQLKGRLYPWVIALQGIIAFNELQ